MAQNNDLTQELTLKRATDVIRDSDRDSVGVVRILSGSAGTPGEEREYQAGDEALVEAGQAEWVVAPVHSPAAGRRLDTDAEREQTPRDGIEVYPPAEPTTASRRSQARVEGYVDAHSDTGVGEKLAAARAETARNATASDGDAKTQAALGGLSARSGPVTAPGDLTPAVLAGDDTAASATARSDAGGAQPAKKAASKPSQES
jgi:hypothetical protein